MSPPPDVERPGRGDHPQTGPVNQNADGGGFKDTVADRPAWPAENTMHDVIARALTLVVVPSGGRRSLPDTYQDRTRKVLKAIESLERLHRDPRFPASLQEIQRRNLPVVVNHAAAKLNDVRDVLASDGTGVAL